MMGRLERASLAAIAFGVFLWLAAPAFADLGYDANTYVATGHGWARHGELILEWGDVLTFAPTPPMHSHHFPPAYPVYLGVVFVLFGYGLAQAKAAAIGASLLALGVVYLATRDLYGHRRALVVSALFALSPWMLWVTIMGFSEGLALALFALTMWGILRSLRDERFIVLAGVFAGLAYLARSSMGAFFLLAGLAGLAWRIRHRGWKRTLSSPWYGLAILAFGLIVGLWAWRNVHLFGWPNWETSPGTRGIPRWIWEHKGAFVAGLLVRTPLLLAVLAPFVALLWPEARRSLARVRDEHTSGLWLAVVLVWLLGVIFSAAYFSMGPSFYELFRLDNMRYVVVGLVPLAWALVREADLDARAFRRRYGALLSALLVGCLLVLTFPPQYLPAQAARALDPVLQEGDSIAVAGAGKYPFYAYVSHPERLRVYTYGDAGPDDRPTFILSLHPIPFDGYVRLLEKTQPHPWWFARPDHVAVWAREDVAAARGIVLEEPRPGW